VQRERAQAAAAGALEHGQLQDVLVQVHGDVGPQLVREVVQELGGSEVTYGFDVFMKCHKCKLFIYMYITFTLFFNMRT
jgi:hypothetical protein